jgi:hypothetical protein
MAGKLVAAAGRSNYKFQRTFHPGALKPPPALTGVWWLISQPDSVQQQRNQTVKVKITSQDTSMGCVSGQAARLQVRSARPVTVFAEWHLH